MSFAAVPSTAVFFPRNAETAMDRTTPRHEMGKLGLARPVVCGSIPGHFCENFSVCYVVRVLTLPANDWRTNPGSSFNSAATRESYLP